MSIQASIPDTTPVPPEQVADIKTIGKSQKRPKLPFEQILAQLSFLGKRPQGPAANQLNLLGKGIKGKTTTVRQPHPPVDREVVELLRRQEELNPESIGDAILPEVMGETVISGKSARSASEPPLEPVPADSQALDQEVTPQPVPRAREAFVNESVQVDEQQLDPVPVVPSPVESMPNEVPTAPDAGEKQRIPGPTPSPKIEAPAQPAEVPLTKMATTPAANTAEKPVASATVKQAAWSNELPLVRTQPVRGPQESGRIATLLKNVQVHAALRTAEDRVSQPVPAIQQRDQAVPAIPKNETLFTQGVRTRETVAPEIKQPTPTIKIVAEPAVPKSQPPNPPSPEPEVHRPTPFKTAPVVKIPEPEPRLAPQPESAERAPVTKTEAPEQVLKREDGPVPNSIQAETAAREAVKSKPRTERSPQMVQAQPVVEEPKPEKVAQAAKSTPQHTASATVKEAIEPAPKQAPTPVQDPVKVAENPDKVAQESRNNPWLAPIEDRELQRETKPRRFGERVKAWFESIRGNEPTRVDRPEPVVRPAAISPQVRQTPAEALREQVHERIQSAGESFENIQEKAESRAAGEWNDSRTTTKGTQQNQPLQAVTQELTAPQQTRTTQNIQALRQSALLQTKLADMIATRLESGSTQARFLVDGGRLGSIEIKCQQQENHNHVVIVVESEHTRADLQRIMPQVQENLFQKGIQLSELQVEVRQEHQQQEMAAGQQGQHSRSGNGRGGEGVPGTSADSNEQPITRRDYGYNTMEVTA